MPKQYGVLAALDRSYALPTVVRQSLFVGRSANWRDQGDGCTKAAFTRPPKKNGKYLTWPANRHITGIINPYYGLGAGEPGKTNYDWDVGKPDPKMVGTYGWAEGPLTQMPGGQVRHGEIHYVGNTYANYFAACGRGARAIEVNIHSHDHNPPTQLRGSSLPGTDMANRIWIPEPRVMDITLQQCLRMDCDGPKQAMFIDVDGSFTGLAPGNHIMARADFFNVQSGDNRLTHYWDEDDRKIPAKLLYDPNPSSEAPAAVTRRRGMEEVSAYEAPCAPDAAAYDPACRARKRIQAEVAYNGFGTYRGLPDSDTTCALKSEWNSWHCDADA